MIALVACDDNTQVPQPDPQPHPPEPVRWGQKIAGQVSSSANGLDHDNEGSVYVAGHVEGSATFPDTVLAGRGSDDFFLGKYDAMGNFLWVRDPGGDDRDVATSIAADASDNIIITGRFTN